MIALVLDDSLKREMDECAICTLVDSRMSAVMPPDAYACAVLAAGVAIALSGEPTATGTMGALARNLCRKHQENVARDLVDTRGCVR